MNLTSIEYVCILLVMVGWLAGLSTEFEGRGLYLRAKGGRNVIYIHTYKVQPCFLPLSFFLCTKKQNNIQDR